MKKILFSLFAFLLFITPVYAQRIDLLDEQTSPNADDYTIILHDPTTLNPLTQKSKLSNLGSAIGFANNYTETFRSLNLITKGPWVDIRAFMDGLAGRPTYATWYANQATTDVASVLSAFLAAGAGKDMYIPPGIYRSSTSQNFPSGRNTQLRGVPWATILLFTGATDGLVLPDGDFNYCSIDGIQIQTSNAGGGKALKADFTIFGGGIDTLRNIKINVTGSGRWQYGLYARNFQSSSIHDLQMYMSAETLISLGGSCNALSFYNANLDGATWTLRGIDVSEIIATGDTWWFGGTIQSFFSASVIRANSGSIRMFGTHIENLYGYSGGLTPTDGADIVIGTTRVMTNSVFNGVQGSSFLIGNPGIEVVHVVIRDSEVGSIVFGNYSHDCEVSGTRLFSYTDGGLRNRRIACSTSSGYALSDIFPASWENPFILGGSYFWVSAGGKLYIKSSAPANDTDGTIVGSQS